MQSPSREIRIKVTADEYQALTELAEYLSLEGTHFDKSQVTLDRLVTMVVQDTAMAHTRPGSWEGSGIIDLLQRHGYSF